MKNKTRRWLLPAVSVAVKQTLQIFVCYRRGTAVQIFRFSDFSCRATAERLALRLLRCPSLHSGCRLHQRCFICSSPAANLMAPSSAKCPFNLAEETQVVSLTIPARRAPAFSLAVTAGERRTEGERERKRGNDWSRGGESNQMTQFSLFASKTVRPCLCLVQSTNEILKL